MAAAQSGTPGRWRRELDSNESLRFSSCCSSAIGSESSYPCRSSVCGAASRCAISLLHGGEGDGARQVAQGPHGSSGLLVSAALAATQLFHLLPFCSFLPICAPPSWTHSLSTLELGGVSCGENSPCKSSACVKVLRDLSRFGKARHGLCDQGEERGRHRGCEVPLCPLSFSCFSTSVTSSFLSFSVFSLCLFLPLPSQVFSGPDLCAR